MNPNIERLLKPTFWKVVATIIIVLGLYTIYLRFTGGLGAVTNLNDHSLGDSGLDLIFFAVLEWQLVDSHFVQSFIFLISKNLNQ